MHALEREECVLVVDDDRDSRDTLCDVIEAKGCLVLMASNGREALAILAQRRPCLMILDLLMPIMSGAELLEELKRHPEHASLNIVISTSASHLAPPGMTLLAKPFALHDAWALLRKSCRCAAE